MGFIFNQNAGETPETIARKRMIAQAMQQQGTDTSSIQHPLQGVARIAQALSGNWANSRLDKAQKEGRAGASDNFARVMAALTQGGAPQPAMAPQMAPSQPSAMPSPKGGTFQNMLQIESGMNPNAVSPKGATGIAQIMPDTARDPGFGVPNIFDFAKKQGVQVADNSDATLQALLRNPQVNAGFGEAYFNAQKQRYGGDERLAAAAYNAGPGAVDKAGGVPNIQETQDYVRKLGLNGQQPPQQVAQAQPQQPQIQPASMQTGPDAAAMQQLMGVLTDQWASPEQKAVAQMLLKPMLEKPEAKDPLDAQYKQMQIEKLKSDIAKANSPDARAKLGLNPQYGVDAQGNPVLLQIGENGTAVQTQMPDGVTLSKEPIKLDAGTHYVLLDPITRQPVGQIPKNVAGEAAAAAGGKVQGETLAQLPQAEAGYEAASMMLRELKGHKGLNSAVGTFQGLLPDGVVGSMNADAADFRSRAAQLQGQTFLRAFENLKGGGAITEIEGMKAEQAIGRLRQAVSEEDFKTALDDLQGILDKGIAAFRAKAGGNVSSPQQAAPAQKRLKFNPTTGELE